MNAKDKIDYIIENISELKVIIDNEKSELVCSNLFENKTQSFDVNVFDEALAHTLEIEGGLSDRDLAADPGGLTNLGITQGTLDSFNRRFPKYNLPRSVRDLTPIQAKIIYKKDYWDASKCDQLPNAIAVLVFDMAVNAGVHRAAVLMQRTLGVAQDGKIGPITLRAANNANVKNFLSYYSMHRMIFYTSLSNWKHNPGWARRTVDCAVFANKFL